MKHIHARVSSDAQPTSTLTLTYDQRTKSRFRAVLDSGEPVGIFLQRGAPLMDGDRLATEDGLVVAVVAAPESLSVVRTTDPLLLARAAYHLGNRHMPLQITEGRLAYQHDHVLDDLVRQLGLLVEFAQAPFHPEPGAYGNGAHHHAGHGHGPARGQVHQYEHTHDDEHEHGH